MSLARRGSIRLFALASAVLLGCLPAESSDDVRSFLAKTIPEQRASIAMYPADKQIDLYLAAMHAQHPPDLGLADHVAASGAVLVPVLIRHLSIEESDLSKLLLVDVLYRMQMLGYYSVRTDPATMAALEVHVAKMKDPQWKAMAEERVEAIRRI